MSRARIIAFLRRLLLTILLVLTTRSLRASAEVTLRLRVLAPAGTQESALKVVGDHSRLGAWQPDKAPTLARKGERGGRPIYEGTLRLPAGVKIAFKLCRDGWATVEKTAKGGEVANRTWTAAADQTVELEVARWADRRANSTASVGVELLGNYGKASTGIDRPVWVFSPPGTKAKALPLLFMLDGQNIFDRATAAFGEEWAADEALLGLLKKAAVRPVRIVAIGNSRRRMAEYTPDRDPRYPQGGELAKTHALIVKELLPALKTRYGLKRGARQVGIAGSSLGGLAAFHLALDHPEVYGFAAVVSPSFWWHGGGTLKRLKAAKSLPRATRLWIDMGTAEGDGEAPVRDARAVVQRLRELGFSKRRLRFLVDKGGTHSEGAWRRRCPEIFAWLLPKPRKAREPVGAGQGAGQDKRRVKVEAGR